MIGWMIPHLALAGSMAAGLEFHMERYANMARFAVWVLVGAYAFLLWSDQATAIAKDMGPSVPPNFALMFDMTLAFYLASHGLFGSAGLYALVAAVSFIVFKSAELPTYVDKILTPATVALAVRSERVRCLAVVNELLERQQKLAPGHAPCPFVGDMIEVGYRINNPGNKDDRN